MPFAELFSSTVAPTDAINGWTIETLRNSVWVSAARFPLARLLLIHMNKITLLVILLSFPRHFHTIIHTVAR